MTKHQSRRTRPIRCAAAAALLALAWLAPRLAAGAEEGERVRVISAQKLPNVPGKTLTAVAVAYAPGGKSRSHRHAGVVLVYVVSGAIRSQVGDAPAHVYHAGETFFEGPEAHHAVSENASTTQPAELLAVFVADDGANLTTLDP